MTRIFVHINQLVVHGGAPFAAESFGEELRQEIVRRIGQGAKAADIALRFQGESPVPWPSRSNAVRRAEALAQAQGPAGQHTPERTAAATVAGRLLK